MMDCSLLDKREIPEFKDLIKCLMCSVALCARVKHLEENILVHRLQLYQVCLRVWVVWLVAGGVPVAAGGGAAGTSGGRGRRARAAQERARRREPPAHRAAPLLSGAHLPVLSMPFSLFVCLTPPNKASIALLEPYEQIPPGGTSPGRCALLHDSTASKQPRVP